MIRLKALGIHVNPIDGCQYSNELRAQLNLTRNHQKEKEPHLNHVLSPILIMNMMHKAEQSLEQRRKKKVVAASGYAEMNPLKGLKPHGGQLFNQATTTG